MRSLQELIRDRLLWSALVAGVILGFLSASAILRPVSGARQDNSLVAEIAGAPVTIASQATSAKPGETHTDSTREADADRINARNETAKDSQRATKLSRARGGNSAGPSTTSQEPEPKQACRSRPIGESVRRRPIIAYFFNEFLRPVADTTIVFGAFHGDEPVSAALCDRLVYYLKAHPEKLFGRRVIIVPRVNPDGLAAGTRVNAHKVDLNRNWPTNWSPEAAKPRYNPGPSPLSEPESKAVKALLDEYNPSKVISVHSPLHMLNPTGPGIPLAKEMAKHNHYRVDTSVGYATPGSFGDYCGITRDIAIVTLELPNVSANSAWSRNREALLTAILYVRPE